MRPNLDPWPADTTAGAGRPLDELADLDAPGALAGHDERAAGEADTVGEQLDGLLGGLVELDDGAGEDAPHILRNIFVRVWAELGRTHMSLGGALELTAGAVVELDQAAEEPVELFANGVCFASGCLLYTSDAADE